MQSLIEAYKALRTRGLEAHAALSATRAAMSFPGWTSSAPVIRYNPPFTGAMRHVENPQNGLRLVGFADEVYSGRMIDHTGWFADSFQDATYRGIVYQIPARNGTEQYVAGYQSSDDDNCVVLDFSETHQEKNEAARAADECARASAGRAREYNEAWQAGARWCDMGNEAATLRASVRTLTAELRTLAAPLSEAICGAVRAQLLRQLDTLNGLRVARKALANGAGIGREHTFGFYPGSADMRAAFNDGAQTKVI